MIRITNQCPLEAREGGASQACDEGFLVSGAFPGNIIHDKIMKIATRKENKGEKHLQKGLNMGKGNGICSGVGSAPFPFSNISATLGNRRTFKDKIMKPEGLGHGGAGLPPAPE